MGGGGGKETVTKNEIPDWAVPYAGGLLNVSWANANQPYKDRIAPFSQDQNTAFSMIRDRATQGSPLMTGSNQMLTDTVNGKYLDPTSNPAWAPTMDRIRDEYQRGIAPQTAAAFANAGAGPLGESSAYLETMGANNRAFGDTLAQAGGELYNAERLNQMRAAMFAPQYAQAEYQDAQALAGIGDVQQDYQQDLLSDLYNYPRESTDYFANTLGRAIGGAGSTTGPNPYQRNRAASGIGGALGGAGLGYMIGSGASIGGPYGAAIGAGVGLLGGLL